MQDKIQQLINKQINNKTVFGITLRIEDISSDVIFNGASGNLQVDSQYFIASTTKLYTIAMVMKLRSENKLALTDKISRFLDEKIIKGLCIHKEVDYSDQITIKQLLAHTSGIPDYFGGKQTDGSSYEGNLTKGIDQPYTFEEAIEWAKAMPAPFQPGQKGKALYSDTNFQLLGRIIEIVRNDILENIFINEIFLILDLKQTYVFTNKSEQKPVSMYFKENLLSIPLAMSCMASDGGIVSTTAESMKFIRGFFTGKFFPKEYLNEMCKDYNNVMFPLQYGTGIMRFQLPAIFTFFRHVPELLGHSGLSGAFDYFAPEKGLYFTGTVNQISDPSISYKLLTQILMMLT